MTLDEFLESRYVTLLREAMGQRTEALRLTTPCRRVLWAEGIGVPPGERRSAYLVVDAPLLEEVERAKRWPAPARLNAFELLRAALGDEGLGTQIRLRPGGEAFHQMALGFSRIRDIAAPACVASTLRPYQLRGFRWLASLVRNGLGAVLADDMGLGKTCRQYRSSSI